MQDDFDMKIVGEMPSRSMISSERKDEPDLLEEELQKEIENGNIERAKLFGAKLAEMFDGNDEVILFGAEMHDDINADTIGYEDSLVSDQRRILFAFVATVGLDRFCISPLIAGTSRRVFYNRLKELNSDLYAELSDSSAFSFYYLAYRRGGEVERRIGQTFAMLCSRDGDPVYQELGEALYCWFLSAVEQKIQKSGLHL